MADETPADAERTRSVSDVEYKTFVEDLSATTADDLRAARGNPDAQRAALTRFYGRGANAGLTSGEMIDHLAVNSPSILTQAGYSAEEADALMELSEALTEDELESFTIE